MQVNLEYYSICSYIYVVIYLYLFYDDLLQYLLLQGTSLKGFADDVTLVMVAHKVELLEMSANSSLEIISTWIEKYELQLAPEKT